MNNVLVFARVSKGGKRQVVCIANLAPVPREGYRVGLPLKGEWTELLNTDSAYYGGTGVGNMGKVEAEATAVARPTFLGGRDAAATRGRLAAACRRRPSSD